MISSSEIFTSLSLIEENGTATKSNDTLSISIRYANCASLLVVNKPPRIIELYIPNLALSSASFSRSTKAWACSGFALKNSWNFATSNFPASFRNIGFCPIFGSDFKTSRIWLWPTWIPSSSNWFSKIATDTSWSHTLFAAWVEVIPWPSFSRLLTLILKFSKFISLPLTDPTYWDVELKPPLLKISPTINASKQKPITSIKSKERCLIFDKTAISD